MSHDAPAYNGHRPPPLPPSSHQSSPSSTTPQNNGLAAANSAPHQPPAMPAAALDLLAKMNVTPEQFMQIAQMIQSGAVPFGSTASQMQPAAPPPAWGQPAVAQPAQQVSTVPHPAPQDDVQDMDVDKEEGEVEEENLQTSQTHDFLSKAPTGPRDSPRFANGSGSTQHGGTPQAYPVAAGHYAPSSAREVRKTTVVGARDETSPIDIESKSAAVRSFLAAVYQNGYRYNDVVKYVPNTEFFQRVWTNMGYEVEDAANTSPEPKQPIKRAPTKPTAPQDRTAYLAKLQAAKKKKLETATATSASKQTITDNSPVAKPQPVVATPAPPSMGKVSQPAKRTIDNNLIRQRLERLKAERAEAEARKKSAPLVEGSKTMSSPAPFSNGSISAASGLAADHAAPAFSPPAPNVAVGQTHIPEASASPTISRGFGLPGLFTSSVPVASPTTQSQAFRPPGDANRAPSQPQHKTMSLPNVRVDGDSQSSQTAPITSTSNVPAKRPYGMSRSTSYDEPFVIEDSDPESDDEAKAEDHAAEQEHLAKASSANIKLNSSSVPGTPQGSNEMDKKIAELKAELAQKMAATRARQQKRQLMENRTGDVSGQDTPQSIADESASIPPTGNGTPAGEEAANLHMNTELATAQQTFMSSKSTDAETREADAAGFSHYETSGPMDGQSVHINALQSQGDIQGSETGVMLNGETELDIATDNPVEPRGPSSNDNNNLFGAMESARQDDEVGEVDDGDDDDDDYDSIYADPGPQVPSVSVPTQAVSDAPDEENDSDSAMDTSSDTSEDDYYATDRNAQHEAEPSPEPNSMHTSFLEPAVDSVDNTIDLTDADQGDEAEPPLDDQIDDDLASELQPSSQQHDVVSDVQATGPVKYTPYISPLRPFKDFRYHPEFKAEVPGGFKSISYNHKIDPNKMVCPFETAGGICNDKTCEFQHFKAMSLSDNELLKLMGADQIPAKQPADIQRWKSGLASLIARIRSEKQGRDVGAIAQRIAEYRREFIGDPSKTLLLD